MHRVSIIIPTFNNLELTGRCLARIRANTLPETYEIVVVDNASADGTAEFLKAQEDIRLILNEENRNFAGACNQGARASEGEFLVFLNDDTEVHPGWLEPIVADFEADEGLGAVGVKLLYPNGRIQHAGVVFFDSKFPEHLYRLAPAAAARVNKRREFQAVTAACIAIRRDVFIEVGGFDEAFRNGYEDIDLCLKIGAAGYRILYEPDSVVTHHESVSTGRHDHGVENLDLLMSRWRNVRSDAYDYLRQDGFNAIQVLWSEVRHMAYVPEEYGTIPRRVLVLRAVYMLPGRAWSVLGRLAKKPFGGPRGT